MGAVTSLPTMWDGHPHPGESLHRCSLFHQSSILMGEAEFLIFVHVCVLSHFSHI